MKHVGQFAKSLEEVRNITEPYKQCFLVTGATDANARRHPCSRRRELFPIVDARPSAIKRSRLFYCTGGRMIYSFSRN